LPNELVGQYAHKACKYNQIWLVSLDSGRQSLIKILSTVVLFVINKFACDASLTCSFQSVSIGFVADYSADAGINLFVANRINNSLQVATAAGNKDNDIAGFYANT
jgi:hypothetical protein